MSPRAVPKRPKILPRRPQDGLEELFFRIDFYHRFWCVLGSDFGAIWDPFWEPKSVILGIDFLMIFACRSKIAPRAAQEPPKSGQEPPKSLPRAAKSGQESPKSGKK